MGTPVELLEVVEILEAIRDGQRRVAYGVRDAARQLGVSESHMRRLIAQGVVARVPHVGHRVVVAHDELVRLVRPPAEGAPPEPVRLPRRAS